MSHLGADPHLHPGRHDTIRIGSAAVALFTISDLWRVRHPDPVVWDPLSLRVFVTTSVAYLLLGIVNVVVASLGLLQALILILLTSPAAIFSNFVREMGASPGSAAESDPAE